MKERILNHSTGPTIYHIYMDCKDSWHLDLLYSSPPNSCIPRHRQLRFLQLLFAAICGHDPKESGGRGDLSGKNDDNGDNDDDGDDDHE